MTESREPGRRERKKALTRRAISEAAMGMFLERGYEAVTIKQVADRADVSLATVYAHFPQKEALVFDEDDERRDSLLEAVTKRHEGQRIIEALHEWLRRLVDDGKQYAEQHAAFEAMIQEAPALVAYERAMWLRHEGALAAAIADELAADHADPRIRLFAHFVLESWSVVDVSDDPLVVLDATFALLEPGWLAVEPA